MSQEPGQWWNVLMQRFLPRERLVPPRVCLCPLRCGSRHTLDWVLGGLDPRAVFDLNRDLGEGSFLVWPQ